MSYISETVEIYEDNNPELGNIAKQSICSRCPAGVWQIGSDNNGESSLFCLCTKLHIKSYSITQSMLTNCDYQAIALSKYESKAK